MQHEIGKRVVNISDILDVFEAQEGEVQHIIGKTGMGKTYEATRRALQYLYSGYTVYTTWRLNLPDYYDEREHFWPTLRNLLFFRKNFFRFDLKNNWNYVNLDDYNDERGIFNTEKFANFLASLTDCVFMLDEGQDVFDSHQRAGKIARQTITRTRHMHKTLIVISQRAQAVDVTARGNVTYFYKCEKRWLPFIGTQFRVYRTDDIDEGSNYPIWVRHDSTGRVVWQAELWHKGRAKKHIYDAYDSWYMRQQQVRSQDIKVDAYELTFRDRFQAFMRSFRRKKVIPLSTDLSPENGKIEGYGTTRPSKLGTARKIQVRSASTVGTEKVQARPIRRDELLHAPQPIISHGTKKSIRSITRDSLDSPEMAQRKKEAAAPLM